MVVGVAVVLISLPITAALDDAEFLDELRRRLMRGDFAA